MKIMKNWLIYGSYDNSHSPTATWFLIPFENEKWECQRRLSGWLTVRTDVNFQVLPWRCWPASRFAGSYMLRLCRVRFSIRNRPWLQLAPNSWCRDDCEMEYEKGIVLLGWNGRRKLTWSGHDFVHCVFSLLAVLSRFLVAIYRGTATVARGEYSREGSVTTTT
jgi:hypothetical protein